MQIAKSCNHKRPCYDDGKCHFTKPCEHQYLTNADRIRAMSDEELARFLARVENRRSAAGNGAMWNGMANALDWLRQPAEEEHHDKT